jgi:hypothetical protein
VLDDMSSPCSEQPVRPTSTIERIRATFFMRGS